MSNPTTLLIFYYGKYTGDCAIERRLSELTVRTQTLAGLVHPHLTHVSAIIINNTLCHLIDLTADDGLIITPMTHDILESMLDDVELLQCVQTDTGVSLEYLTQIVLKDVKPLNLLTMYHNIKNGDFSDDSCTTPVRRILDCFGLGGKKLSRMFTAGQLFHYVELYNSTGNYSAQLRRIRERIANGIE